MVTVEPFFFALTSTPSIGPSSVELTCPVSASPGEFAAPVRSGTRKNSAAAAVTMTNAKKVFLSIRTSPRFCVKETAWDPASLNTRLKRASRSHWPAPRSCLLGPHSILLSRSTWPGILKKKDLTRRAVGHHRWLYRRALPISYPNGNSGRQANSPNAPPHRFPLDSAAKALELPRSTLPASSKRDCID